MTAPPRRATVASVAALSLAGIAAPAALASSHHATQRTAGSTHHAAAGFAHSANAYGSRAALGSTVASGSSAPSPLGCTTRPDRVRQNHTTGVHAGDVAQVGAVTTRVASSPTRAGDAQTASRSRTTATSLLKGAVRLRALDVRAAVVDHSGRLRRHDSTKVVGLRLGGKPVHVTGKPNQVVRLGKLATVTIDQQRTVRGPGSLSTTVDGLVVELGRHTSFGKAGGLVVIGHATAGLTDPAHQPLVGTAYGTAAHVGNAVVSQRTFLARLKCATTLDQRSHRSGASVAVARAVRTGAVVSRASTSRHDSVVTTRSTVTGISLLRGLVTARLVQADAHGTRDRRGAMSFTSKGSRVVGLRIDGHTYSGTQAAGTRITIPGVGVLWLRRTVTTHHQLRVHVIDLVLGTPRDGMHKGTEIVVGNATVGNRA